MKTLQKSLMVVAAFATLSFTSCANKTQNGALIGAGAGALAGQAIGRNTKSSLIGAAAGSALGAAIGHNEDKKDRARYRY